MTEIALALFLFLTLTALVYAHVGFDNILKSYRMSFEDDYWVNYNVVEAIAWIAKAAVIIPGLVWQREIWQLHVVTLLTSALLIWAQSENCSRQWWLSIRYGLVFRRLLLLATYFDPTVSSTVLTVYKKSLGISKVGVFQKHHIGMRRPKISRWAEIRSSQSSEKLHISAYPSWSIDLAKSEG